MRQLTCAATRRRLEAFHDHELSLHEQVRVAAHLEWCDACADLLADTETVGVALRAGQGSTPGSDEEMSSLHAAVVSRAKAEYDTSPSTRIREMFEDWRLVYVGFGALAASVACLVVTLGMIRFSVLEQAGPLATLVNVFEAPGTNLHPVPVANQVLMPRVLNDAFESASRAGEQDAVFTLEAVVTREGRIANLGLLYAQGADSDAKLIEALLRVVSRARFEPARFNGLPVAVNMVLMVARTTVRATSQPEPAPPVVKKRIA